MRRFPPRDEPPRRPRQDLPRPESPFERLLKRRPERDPAPIIIGGTIGFLALVIVLVFVLSSVLGGSGGNGTRTGDERQIAPGVTARTGPLPGLPPGLVAMSEFMIFRAEEDTAVEILMPLTQRADEPAGLGFYSYREGRWQRQAEVTRIEREGRLAGADFTTVPENLAVLRVVSQAYQVAALLPRGGSLHADATVNIVSPRDYAPAGDGSVQGSPTNFGDSPTFAVMPTIVGSGADTAPVVDEILADDSLRSQHIQAIVSLVQEQNHAGIDLEYSSVSSELSSEFTSFVEALGEALRGANKRLSLTLPPPTQQRQAFEWSRLGEAADFIKILPVADPVAYWQTMPDALGAVIQEVDPQKVMLVVSPFSVESIGDSSRPIGYLQSMVIAADAVVRDPQDPAEIKPGVTVRLVARNLDESEGATALRWDDSAASIAFTTGGTERRRIYIENSFSIGFKLEMVQAYGLAGVAVADGSAQSDVANVWRSINELISAATVSLTRPNETTLLPVWQVSEGDIGAGAGTSATWTAPGAGQHTVVLVVSDGERRFGREVNVAVQEDVVIEPPPAPTFPPETPEPTPEPTPEATPEPTPEAELSIAVSKLANGDDGDTMFSSEEFTSPGSSVTYLITIENQSNVHVIVASLHDSIYGDVACLTDFGNNMVGLELDPGETLQCTFISTAPEDPGVSQTNVITVAVTGPGGAVVVDQDSATIHTTE